MTRRYDSPGRAEAKQRTRTAIVEAMVDQLAQGRDDFVLPEVARRAGVSVRTVQLHFPDRESRLAAVADALEERLGRAQPPSSPAEVLAHTRRMYDLGARDLGIMRASAAPGVAREIQRRRKAARQHGLARVVARLAPDPESATMVTALARHLISAQTGLALLDEHGLSPRRSGAVVTWTLELVFAALARGEGPASKAKMVKDPDDDGARPPKA